MLGVTGADLEQVAIVAGDVMDLEDFGDSGELVGRRHLRAVLRGPHGDERQHAPVDHVRVDKCDVILDNALGFELSQAFENRRGRQTHGLCQLSLRGSGVVLKNIQNRAVYFVNCSFESHMRRIISSLRTVGAKHR